MVGGTALDGGGDDLTGQGLGIVLQVRLDLLDLHGGLVADLVLNRLQQILLGLLLGQAGELLQLGLLGLQDLVGLVLRLSDLGEALVQLLLLALEGLGLLVQGGFLLFQTALLLAQLRPAFLHFFFVLCARSMDFVLGFKEHFFLLVFAAPDGLVDEPGGFRLSRADGLLRDLLAVDDTDDDADSKTHDQGEGIL